MRGFRGYQVDVEIFTEDDAGFMLRFRPGYSEEAKPCPFSLHDHHYTLPFREMEQSSRYQSIWERDVLQMSSTENNPSCTLNESYLPISPFKWISARHVYVLYPISFLAASLLEL